MILEVLSTGTESYDRRLKWRSYPEIPALEDYVMVSQGGVRLEHYQRAVDSSWRYRTIGAGESLVLSTGAVIDMDAVYTGVFGLDGDAA